jgi:Abnormal spindle-like microcephaly-assoc'd, ASPM-SPD-2-Hydin
MNDNQTKQSRLAPTIAIVVSCIGLFSACGIGVHDKYVPPPPPPIGPIVASTHILTFDPTPIGAISPAKQLTFKNTSAQPIPIRVAEVLHPEGFARTTDCGDQLAAGESCTVNVTFNPQDPGSLNAQIIVFSHGFQPVIVLLRGASTRQHQAPKDTPPS